MESSEPKPIVEDAAPSGVIRDIVVNSDRSGYGFGWANSIGFETTPEGFQDNIRIVYGLNSSGKTSMMRTIHELFRGGDRGKHVLHDRIAGDFEMVEEIPGSSKAEEAGKTLLGEAEKQRGKPVIGLPSHPLVYDGPVAARLTALLGADLLSFPIDRFPEGSRDALRRIGGGTHSWAYHYDREGHWLETKTIQQLKELLREHDLPSGGAKAVLIKRLQDYDCDVFPEGKEGDTPEVKEYLFIDRGAISKRITREARFGRCQDERPVVLNVTVLGQVISPDRVWDFTDVSAKAFGSLYLDAMPSSELSYPDAMPPGPMPPDQRIHEMKASELKDELRRLGLPHSGNKISLVGKLHNGLRKEAWKQKTKRRDPPSEEAPQIEWWNHWVIHEQMGFPGLDYTQSAELFEEVLPCTWDDIRELDGKISAFNEMLELSDEELSSVIERISKEIETDAEFLRANIRNQADEHKDRRQTQLENLQNTLSMLSSVSPMKFEFCQDQFVSKDTHMTSTYEDKHTIWSVNGFRILTDWWKLSSAINSEHSQTREFQNRDMTRFRTVFLDCDRVAIDRKSGVVERGRRRESAVGLEREIRDFWAAYPSYDQVREHLQNVRDVLDDALREMHRRKKKNFDVRFPALNEWEGENEYLGQTFRNLWHLDLEAVEDRLQSQLFHIRLTLDEQIGPGSTFPNLDDPELYIHPIDEDQAKSFYMVNAIAAVIEPALNILRLGKDFTGLTFQANETYPEFDNPKAIHKHERVGVPHDQLSSGQKHLFSMILPIATASLEAAKGEVWTDLKEEDHILVLIDEPEISLHVNWQEDLVQAVDEALRKNDGSLSCPVSVVFATHSPSILGNHLHRSSSLGRVGGDYVE